MPLHLGNCHHYHNQRRSQVLLTMEYESEERDAVTRVSLSKRCVMKVAKMAKMGVTSQSGELWVGERELERALHHRVSAKSRMVELFGNPSRRSCIRNTTYLSLSLLHIFCLYLCKLSIRLLFSSVQKVYIFIYLLYIFTFYFQYFFLLSLHYYM